MTTALARAGELHIMGDESSQTLVKFTKNGAIRALRTRVRLNPNAGHVYEMKGQQLITAAGYDYLNSALGVTFFMPTTVAGEDGQDHCNPYVIRDDHDNVKRVKIRCVGVGRNAAGNWMAQDSTLYYDLVPMMAQDVLKKWKPHNQEPKKWGVLYDCENIPGDVLKDPRTKCLTIPGGYVLACKLEGEMLSVVSEHAHRVRFATRNAESIVKRNILKRFMGQARLDQAADGYVSVIAWPQADREQIAEVEDMVRRAQSGEMQIGGNRLEVQAVETIVDSVDAEQEALVGEVHEDAAQVGPTEFEPPPLELDELKVVIIRKYTLRNQTVAKKILKENGFDSLDSVNTSTDVESLEKLLEALQERNPDDNEDGVQGS